MFKANEIRSNLIRETLVDKVVDILERRILAGELLPGAKLSEAGIAQEFGVSRIPAREALQRLQEMNFVRKSDLGREVVRFSLEEFREIFELKVAVETFGAMMGALRATDSDLGTIQSTLENTRKCLDLKDLDKHKRLNSQFHSLIVKCSKNQKLISTYTAFVKQIGWVSPLSLQAEDRPKKSFAEHLEIFEAFKHRKAEKVRSLLETHALNDMERVCSQLECKS